MGRPRMVFPWMDDGYGRRKREVPLPGSDSLRHNAHCYHKTYLVIFTTTTSSNSLYRNGLVFISTPQIFPPASSLSFSLIQTRGPRRSSATRANVSGRPAGSLGAASSHTVDWRAEPATPLGSNPVKEERDNYSALLRFSAQIRSRRARREKTATSSAD